MDVANAPAYHNMATNKVKKSFITGSSVTRFGNILPIGPLFFCNDEVAQK